MRCGQGEANLNVFKLWGCLAEVKISNIKVNKLGDKTFDIVFIGYAHNSHANRFLVVKSDSND